MKALVPGFVVLGVLLIASGPGAPRAEPASDGAGPARAHVEKTCVSCHPGPQLDAIVGGRLRSQGREAFDAFLATHHVPDAELRADVIAHLESRLAAASPAP